MLGRLQRLNGSISRRHRPADLSSVRTGQQSVVWRVGGRNLDLILDNDTAQAHMEESGAVSLWLGEEQVKHPLHGSSLKNLWDDQASP